MWRLLLRGSCCCTASSRFQEVRTPGPANSPVRLQGTCRDLHFPSNTLQTVLLLVWVTVRTFPTTPDLAPGTLKPLADIGARLLEDRLQSNQQSSAEVPRLGNDYLTTFSGTPTRRRGRGGAAGCIVHCSFDRSGAPCEDASFSMGLGIWNSMQQPKTGFPAW